MCPISSGLAKTIPVKGERKLPGQTKQWENNIMEYTDLELGNSKRAVENRDNWLQNPLSCFAVKGLMMMMMMIDNDGSD